MTTEPPARQLEPIGFDRRWGPINLGTSGVHRDRDGGTRQFQWVRDWRPFKPFHRSRLAKLVQDVQPFHPVQHVRAAKLDLRRFARAVRLEKIPARSFLHFES